MTKTRWASVQDPGTQQWFTAVSDSPVLDLIQWVSLHHTAQARRWLRQPILLPLGDSTALGPTEQMAIKIFAKRVRESGDLTPPPGPRIAPTPHLPDPDLAHTLPARFASEAEIAQYLQEQLTRLPAARGHTQDRSILALAVDADGRPLGIARARNGLRRDAHAEWVLMQTLSPAAVSRIAAVWTTLKPCRFCATLLYPHAQTQPIRYLEHDPGPWGRATCLDASTPDRTRFYPRDSNQRERLWTDPGVSSITSTNS